MALPRGISGTYGSGYLPPFPTVVRRPVLVRRKPGAIPGYVPPVPENATVDPAAGQQYNGANYQALIENDPTYLLLKSQLQAASVADAASRDAAIKRAYIGFGGHPDLSGLGGGPIDALTQSLADQATTSGISTMSRLNDVHDTNVASIRNSLAARGLARSGETGFQFNREATDYNRANYDATQKLVDYINGVNAAFTNAERERQGQNVSGLNEASQRQASYPWNQTTPAPPVVQTPARVAAPSPVLIRARKKSGSKYVLGKGAVL